MLFVHLSSSSPLEATGSDLGTGGFEPRNRRYIDPFEMLHYYTTTRSRLEGLHFQSSIPRGSRPAMPWACPALHSRVASSGKAFAISHPEYFRPQGSLSGVPEPVKRTQS